VGGRLDQLDEHSTGVLRMDEVDPAVGRTASRLFVQQPHALLANRRHGLVDARDPVRDLLDARSLPLEKPGDDGVGCHRSQQLEADPRVADRQHGLPHLLPLVDLLVHEPEAEVLGVEGDRLVNIGYGDADVVDSSDQAGWEHRSIVADDPAMRQRL
jgi:hypothetical protein